MGAAELKMNSNSRTEKRRWRRRFISIATASAAAATILSTISLPQHAVVAATTAASAAGHPEEEEMISADHRQRKLTEQRRRMEERRRRLEEQWTAEAIQNLQTLDYVLDESDTSNNPRYFIRSRDGMLRPPSDLHVDEDISSLEEEEGESVFVEGISNTEVIHHQKSKLGPTNKGHLQMMSQFQHWEAGDRNLRGGDVIVNEDGVDSIMTFLYDEDDPEEDLDGYDLVYIGSGDDVTIHQQQQRELSLAKDFVGGSSSASSFVSNVKKDSKAKGKSPPQDNDKGIMPFGKEANVFNQIFPKDGSTIGTVQAFGAQVKDAAAVEYVGIQFKDHNNKRSKWYKMPQSEALHDWFMKEMKGFPPNQKWMYRMKAEVPTPRNSNKRKNKKKSKKEVTAWMELAINIEPKEETPPPTPGPSPRPSPSPTSPPSPRPSPNPTSPPSPRPSPGPTPPPSPRPSPRPTPPPSPGPTSPPSSKPTPGPTSPPTPQPTPYPLDYVSQWTKHPTRYPTTETPTFQPTSPPSKHPTQPPTNNPTPNPTNNPTNPPTTPPTHPPTKPPTRQPTKRPSKQPTKPPTPLPTSPPTPEATEAVQQAPPQLLHKHVRDDPWEHGGQIQYSSGRVLVLFFFDGHPFVCTGTVVDDGDHPDRTLILTAGHCAFKYDRNGGRFADYALFIPNQDETRGRGTDETCGNDPLGCWTLAFALVDYNWSTRNFPSSVPWDYAIYVVQNVPESHQPGFIYEEQPELSSILEDIVTRFPIDFTYNQKTAPVTHVHGMGYTFNKDPDFRYCAKDLTTKYGISTYENLWLSVCDMSGGSSGGAWMKDTKDDGSGTIVSVNSWGYSSSTGMAGPNFYTEGGAKVECLFEKAKVIDFDDVKNGGVIVSDC